MDNRALESRELEPVNCLYGGGLRSQDIGKAISRGADLDLS